MARSGIQSKTLIDLMDNSDSLVDGVIRKRQFERKFTSLNDFIKWIINFTEKDDQCNTSTNTRVHRVQGQAKKQEYVIQTSIINNQNVEVNLEIILKLTTFAGNQVYSLVCKNRNLLIKMDKLE